MYLFENNGKFLSGRAVVVMMKLCIPHLIETKGNVVNVSSLSGVRAVRISNLLPSSYFKSNNLNGNCFVKIPGIMAYCMSKAAVTQLTRCAALELAPKGVRVNAVNPGITAIIIIMMDSILYSFCIY